MTSLIDTDRVVDWLKPRPDALELITRLRPDGIAISLVSLGELYDGIVFATDRDAAELALHRFLRLAEVPPLNRSIMRRFAQLRGTLRAQGQLIPDMDLLIAATALHHGLQLVRRNRRHFERVPGLLLYPPS